MNNIKIATKLGLGFAAALVMILLLSSFSLTTFQQTTQQWTRFERQTIAKNDLISAGNRSLGDAIHHFKNYILRGGEYDQKFSADIARLKEITDRYRAIPEITEEERAWLNQIDTAAEVYLSDMARLVEARSQHQKIEEMDNGVKGADKPIYTAFDKLQSLAANDGEQASMQMKARLDDAVSTTLTIMLLALVVMMALSFYITLGITRPLRRTLAVVNRIADGDLCGEIDSERSDEIGQLLAATKKMSDTLKSVLADIAVLAQAASAGELDISADAGRYKGEFHNLVAGFNQALASIAGPVKIASAYVGQIADGTVPEAISMETGGEYRVIRDNLNTLIRTMSQLRAQTDVLIQAAADGELDVRANADLFNNEWERLIAGMNQTLDGIVNPIHEVVEVLAHVEQGD
ncbi:MAG: HAMP domain-containing protein, partial [Methylomonas sp.]|nr:HAMP domain-containing protein [Methylomonas sp.]